MQYFQINTIDVSAEYFDNEVLAINLKTGNYFSLRFSAFVFWKLITGGKSFEDTLVSMSEHYAISVNELTEKFEALLNQLINNELLVGLSSIENVEDTNWLKELDSKFLEPQFECYTDMQDLLLFDPIHDVDTQVGWPKKADDETKQ
jgi:hypothetical protein